MGYTVVQRVITSNDWAYSYLDLKCYNKVVTEVANKI